jgi:hypothetical protein
MASPGPPAPVPAAAPPTDRPARVWKFSYRPTPRAILAFLLIAVFVMGFVSLATSWWGYSSSGAGSSVTINFLPGSNYAVSCTGPHCDGFTAGSFPYSVIGSGGSLGTIYEGVLVLLAAGTALVGLAALFTGLEVLRQREANGHRFLTYVFLGTAALLLLGAAAWTAGGQPGGFPAASSLSGSGGSGASPANSFWGATSTGATQWGAGPGWYLALVGAVLIAGILVVLLALGRQHTVASPERRTRSAVAAAPVAPRGYSAPPTTTSPKRPAVTRPPLSPSASREVEEAPAATVAAPAPIEPVAPPVMIACPECGTQNLEKSRVCSYCQRRLR